MNAVIKLENIHKVYHAGEVDVRAVQGVSLEADPGEFLAIMGASGSGKSTLMNIIGCLDRPTQGRYLLDGTDVSELGRNELAEIRNQKLGFVFQGFNLLSRTSALENTELPMLYVRRRLSGRDQRERALHALELVGLAERGGHHPNQLSGGQQQRVAIARALVNHPALLLADEPTGNLDSQTSIEIMGVFQKLNEQGITLVMVTHELDIARYAKRNVIMRDGKVVSDIRVSDRLNAEAELRRLREAQQACTIDDMMRIWATLRIALRALRRNKMRTVLTMLGIIIGVAAVIAMVGIGNGAKAQIEAQIASLGQNVILIFSGSMTKSGVHSGWGGAGTLTVEDTDAIRRELPGVNAVSPELRSSAQVAAGNQNWMPQILGEGPDYFEIRQWPLLDGAPFTDQDVRGANKVAVIGKTTAQQLFGSQSPVGQIVRIKNVPFTIVGLLSSKGLSVMGSDQDDVLILPYTSAMKRILGVTTLRSIMVQAADPKLLPVVQQQLTELLRQRHRIQPGRDDDFTVRGQQDIAEMATAQSNTMTFLLAAVALVSLIVGGIGIMNIMLVSVTERTREIGIRMAVGARGGDILLQFLIEAVTLSVIGGLIGIGVGIGTSNLVASKMNWSTLTPAWAILAAFLFSALIGIFFGFYPARKASRLDPIDALRYE